MFGLVPVSTDAAPIGSLPSLLAFAASPLAHLRPLDIAIIAIYFGMVIWIGFYLKGQSNTSEEFFMAGPRDDRVDCGPELCFRQPRLAGADGLGRIGVSIRHPGNALVLDRRHSRHAVPGPGDDAVLLRVEDALGARVSGSALRRAGTHCVRDSRSRSR